MDSEEVVDDADMVLVGNQVLRDNRTGRERTEKVVCLSESKANCQEDTYGAYSLEGLKEVVEEAEEDSRRDGLQVELKNMVTRSSVLVLPVECWTRRSQ